MDFVDGQLPKHRERLYPPAVTLALLVTQARMSDASCQNEAVVHDAREANEKEMWVYFLAYNLIRLLMCQAAVQADILPRQTIRLAAQAFTAIDG